MQGSDRFWRWAAVAAVIGLFYLGASLRSLSPPLASSGQSAAHAQLLAPGVSAGGLDLIITQSLDGRSLYCWSFDKWDQDHNRLPVFLETVEAPE